MLWYMWLDQGDDPTVKEPEQKLCPSLIDQDLADQTWADSIELTIRYSLQDETECAKKLLLNIYTSLCIRSVISFIQT